MWQYPWGGACRPHFNQTILRYVIFCRPQRSQSNRISSTSLGITRRLDIRPISEAQEGFIPAVTCRNHTMASDDKCIHFVVFVWLISFSHSSPACRVTFRPISSALIGKTAPRDTPPNGAGRMPVNRHVLARHDATLAVQSVVTRQVVPDGVRYQFCDASPLHSVVVMAIEQDRMRLQWYLKARVWLLTGLQLSVTSQLGER